MVEEIDEHRSLKLENEALRASPASRGRPKSEEDVLDWLVRLREEMSADNLAELLRAQCRDEQIAAFYGYGDVETWKRDIEADGDLHRTYMTSRRAGEAEFMLSQWRMGLMDRTMSMWVGKQHLGQSEKVETKVTLSRIEILPGEEADAYRRMLGGGLPVIDVESGVVESEVVEGG